MYRQRLEAEQGATQDLVKQRLDRIENSSTARATVEVLETQLIESNADGEKYFEEATTFRLKSDGLERDSQKLESSLKSNANKLEETEKNLQTSREAEQSLKEAKIRLEAEQTSLTTQLRTVQEQANQSAERLAKLEADKETWQDSVRAARLEVSQDLQNTRQSLTNCETELQEAQKRYDRLKDRYDVLEDKRNELIVSLEDIRSEKGRQMLDSQIIDQAFPMHLAPVSEPEFAWTLSMCTLDEMRRYFDSSFQQLLARLSFVLPIHDIHETALPILEVMLHKIRDSEVVDLLVLQNLLTTVWADANYVRSDDRDLCECRTVEVILRASYHHGRHWATFQDIEKQWANKIHDQQPLIVRAYMRWAYDISESVKDTVARVYTVPELLCRDIAPSDVVRTLREGFSVAETQERLMTNDSSSPRTLLAGKLFPSISAYLLVDLSKQEVLLFRSQGCHYLNDRKTLTLPERFGHHHNVGATINPGYTEKLGGTFETPKQVRLGQGLFVCDHMEDIFDADEHFED
jgi:hypothetical protein